MPSPDPFYKTKEWFIARAKVLKRDNYCCVICGCNVRVKGASRVDHIKPRLQFPELALVLSNLRTLCASCDNKRHAEKGGGTISPVDENGYPEDWR